MAFIFREFLLAHPVFHLDALTEKRIESGESGLRSDAMASKEVKGQTIRKVMQSIYASTTAPFPGEPWPNPYLVASKLAPDATIVQSAALSFHLRESHLGPILFWRTGSSRGPGEPVAGHDIIPTKTGRYGGNSFVHETKIHGLPVRFARPECALIDLIDSSKSTKALRDVVRSFERLERSVKLKPDIMIDYLSALDRKITWARVGVFIEAFSTDPGMREITATCRNFVPDKPAHWWGEKGARVLGFWNLVIPESTLALLLPGWDERKDLEDKESTSLEGTDYDVASFIGASRVDEIALDSGALDQVAPTFIEEEHEEELQPDSGPSTIEPEIDGDFSDDSVDFDDLEEPPDQPDMGVPEYLGEPCEEEDTPRFNRSSSRNAPPTQDPVLLEKLRNWFKLDEFRPGQAETITALMNGQDAIALLPTGGGKSLIYQFITKMNPGNTIIVISPLVALMDDQIAQATALGLKAGAFHSGSVGTERQMMLTDLSNGNLDLLFLSPESLPSLLLSHRPLTQTVPLVVVDEAHCISLWGLSFRPAFRDLWNLRSFFKKAQILALTATAIERAVDSLRGQLQLKTDTYVHVESVTRTNLKLNAKNVGKGLKPRETALRNFLRDHQEGQGIIYCATRHATHCIASLLKAEKIEAHAYHAGLPQEERRSIAEDFMKGRCRIMVATIAFGMGVNKPDIRFIVHLNLPGSLESYLQEIGRAGRDQAASDCLLLYSHGDAGFQKGLAKKEPESVREIRFDLIREIWEFAEGKACRHAALAKHFGETVSDCGHACDNCQSVAASS